MRKLIKSTLAGLVVVTGLSIATPVDAATKYIVYTSSKANSVAKTKAEIKKYPIRYKINKNDSVVNIAKAAGVSVKDFLKANQITNYKKIEVGTYVLATNSSINSQLKKPYSYTEFLDIEYKTIKKENKALKTGETKVKVKGIKGLKKVVNSYRYIKGIKTLTTKTTIIKEPINKIVEYGPSKEPKYKTYSKVTQIPFKKLTVEDSNLLDGHSYIKQSGVVGQEKETYKVMVLAKGIEVDKTDVKKVRISEPIDEITVVGTKIPVLTDSELSGSVGYNGKYRDTRYESDTTSTKMGYRVGQTTWLGQRIIGINDRLNTTIEELMKKSPEERYADAIDDQKFNSIIFSDNGKTLYAGMRVNYKTQKMFNEYKLFDEATFHSELLKLMNDERKRLGVAPLTINYELKQGNEIRAQEMADNSGIVILGKGHWRPNNTSYLTAFTYMKNPSLGEISHSAQFYGWFSRLFSEKYLAESAYEGWKSSPGHYAAMINPAYKGVYFSVKIGEHTTDYDVPSTGKINRTHQHIITNAIFTK